MKTGIGAINDVYELISGVEVSGNIYKLRRPLNSSKVDIVINTLTLSNEPLQEGVININVHAPNMQNVAFETTDSLFPDSVLLEDITSKIIPLVDGIWKEDFHTDIDSAPEPLQDNDGTWYMNIRLNYYSVINNFTNI